ncbi:unnamed protein product [Rotaria sp. Silwood2]|nr:unnamed protein product [Rotaria sp. Silwood2]CAF4639404.1 unnamed protein product [Rotaria sp. Silwood2]
MSFELYRGQGMSPEEFQTHSCNVGGLISFNNVLSCSTDLLVAIVYAESQDGLEGIIPVILHITGDPHVSKNLFADVRSHSFYGYHEEEFLFSMGTVFRIQSVTLCTLNMRIKQLNLELTSDEDEDLRNLTEYMKQEIGGTNNLTNFGRLLIEMGELDKSEQFYKIVHYNTSLKDDPRTMAMIYNDLGFIASQKNSKQQALLLYKKALDIGHERFPLLDPQLSPIFNNIGEIYFTLEDLDHALENYDKALHIDLNSTPPNAYNLGIRYHNIGMVYQQKRDFRLALTNYKQSLVIKQANLPPKHSSIAVTQRCLGDIYLAQGCFEKALEHCNKALDIEKDSLQPFHPSLSMTYHSLGSIYFAKRQYTDALYAMKTALAIARKTQSAVHSNVLKIETCINDINRRILTMN